ncbi:MAG: shikimate kinase, partial [Propionibacteriaceae bacterium]|nr:shikimate kinase [Propionibacteriaceae bacterium]
MTAPTSEARPEPATPNLGAGAPSGLTRLVLIGLPAAGKSSVGTALAARLSWQHRDTDHWIEQQLGQPVGAIFADQGEDSFRDLETEALRQALTLSSAVISVGGGAVLRPENRQLLASQTVIWLDVSVTTATRRAGLTALRPLLLGDVRQRLTELETERRPLYDS